MFRLEKTARRQADRKQVSVMYTHSNSIPLSAPATEPIDKAMQPFPEDRVHGANWDVVIGTDSQTAVQRSAERDLRTKGAFLP